MLQKPTLFLLNFALCGCILLLVTLVFSAGTPPDVVPHFVVLVFFALGLLGCVNWSVAMLLDDSYSVEN